MPKRGPSGRDDVGGAQARSHRSYIIIPMLLAIVLAFAVIYSSARLMPYFSPVVLGAGCALAFLGALSVIGALLGVVRLGRRSPSSIFFDGLLDAIGDACVVTDKKTRSVYGNASYLRLLSDAGLSRLVGVDILYAGHTAFAEPIYQLVQASQEGRSGSREVRIAAGASAAGALAHEPRWMKLSVTPIMDSSRRGFVLWRLQDITADRAKQEHAFGRLQFIITYLDHAPAGFFSTLPTGRVDYLNATLAEWMGIDVADSQNGELVLADIVGAEGARQLNAIAPVPNAGRTEFFELELTSRQQSLPVDIIHRVDFDQEGQPLPARTLILPRQERPDDASVSGASGALAKFAASAPIGVADINGAGVIKTANDIFLSYGPQVKRGARLSDMVIEADAKLLQEKLELSRQTSGIIEVDATLKGEKPRILQFSIVPLFVGSENRTVFALDITESRALEVQLAQSQKMQAVGQLASGIAHDFNNVLTPIIGFADLLLAKMRPTDPAFADIMNIKQNANRAANLVRQLLAFSRKQTLQPKVHSLTDAMSDLGNLLSRVLGEKIALKISHSRDLGLVLVDINQFEQVIINLAVNARDAMPKGGTLTVRTHNVSEEESRSIKRDPMPAGEYVVCEVTDTGTGIPAEILSKIWEPFFSTKEVGKGTGLGLSTVYGIVKQTGGFIFCDSEIGKGTTFSIYLPRYYPDSQAGEALQPKELVKEKRADHTGNGRILLVEDEDAVRAFAVRALSSRGYTVVEADSGESALEVMEDHPEGFDLILSDVVMPEMDGPTLLRELRKRGVKTKVIFVSGYAEDAFEKNLEGQTDFAFLPKPFSLKQLVEKVKEVMEG